MPTSVKRNPVVLTVNVSRATEGSKASSSSPTTIPCGGTLTSEGLVGYKHNLRNALPATTPASGSSLKLSALEEANYSVTFRSPTNPPRVITDTITGIHPAPSGGGYEPVTLATDLTSAEATALKHVYAKIKSQSQHISGPTVLGELREAVHLIRHPADALFSRVVGYHRTAAGRILGSRPKTIAASYLETSFGWAPLIADVKSAAETIARFEFDHRSTRVQGVGVSENGRSSYDFTNAGFQIDVARNTTSKSEALVRYLVGLSSTDSSPAFGSAARLAELSGFDSWREAPLVAYELMPYSFLLDYFANVDDILNATFMSQANIRWINKTVRFQDLRTVKSSFSFRRTPGDVVISERHQGGSFTSARTSFTRTKLESLPIPPLVFTLPGVMTSQYANMLALLVGKRG